MCAVPVGRLHVERLHFEIAGKSFQPILGLVVHAKSHACENRDISFVLGRFPDRGSDPTVNQIVQGKISCVNAGAL